MGLQLFLVIVASLSIVRGQGLTGPVREFPAITGIEARELQLGQNSDLRALAATFPRIFIELDSLDSVVIVAEGVNANLDCLPWLSRFPGGDIQWYFGRRDEDGIRIGPSTPLFRTPLDTIDVATRIVGGRFNRWLNITATVVVQAAQDSTSGDFVCEVCISRNTPLEQCHNATLTLHILGSPPVLITSPDNEPVSNDSVEVTYNIGADFCLERDPTLQVLLRCEIMNQALVVPTPFRTWVKDRTLLYSLLVNAPTPMLNQSFLEEGVNGVFIPGLVTPQPLDVDTRFVDTGGLLINLVGGSNLTMMGMAPTGVNAGNIMEVVFGALLGDYECTVGNVYGTTTASSTIRECGLDPMFPGCDGQVLLLEAGQTAPVDCIVCIPPNTRVFLSCGVTNTPENSTTTYMWVDPQGNTNTDRLLAVAREGVYNCTAVNNQSPISAMGSTTVFVSPVAEFSAEITDQFGEKLVGNGCSRLRQNLPEEPDVCVFLDEVLNLKCVNSADRTSLPITFENDTVLVEENISVNIDIDNMMLQCQVVSNTPCSVPVNFTVRVFDPARVNRLGAVALNEIAAGQTSSIQVVPEGSPVTLICPTSGIGEPETSWSRIIINMDGTAEEEPLNTTVRGDGTRVLTVIGFNGTQVYVCRTENIAGEDSAIVALTSTPDTGEWVTTGYSDCNILCSGGMRVRSVTCRSIRDNRMLPNSDCTALRPASLDNCSSVFSNECLLTRIFVTGKFGPCSGGCKGGFRTRDVKCVVPMTGEVLHDEDCFPLRRPSPIDSCPNTCCIEDTYSHCAALGPGSCNTNLFQQRCCWTCLLRIKP